LSWAEAMLRGQKHCRINLFPRVFEDGLENTLFVDKVFDELGLASPREPTDGCGRGALVPTLRKEGFGCFSEPIPTGNHYGRLLQRHVYAPVVPERLIFVALTLRRPGAQIDS